MALRLPLLVVVLSFVGSAPGAAPPIRRVDAHGDPLPPGALVRYGTVRLRHGGVQRLAYTPDGKRLLSFGGMDRQDLRLWDVATGRLLGRRRVQPQDLGDVFALAPGGGLYLAGPGAIYYLTGLQGVKKKLFAQEELQPVCAEVSPDGKLLAVGSTEGGILIDVTTGDAVLKLEPPIPGNPLGSQVVNFAFSHDGKRLAASFVSGEVVMYDTAARKQMHTYKSPPERMNPDATGGGPLAFSPDGKYLLLHDPEVLRLLDATAPRAVPGFRSPPDPVQAVSFTSDGKELVAIDQEGKLRRFVTATGKDTADVPVPLHHGEGLGQVVFAPDRKSLAVAQGSSIHFFDLKTGKSRLPHLGSREPLRTARLSAAKEMVSLTMMNRVQYWDPRTGRLLRTHRFADEEAVLDVDRDSRLAMVVALEQPPRMVRITDGKELWKSEEGAAFGAQFSPDGRWLAATSDAGTDVRDARTGKVRRSWKHEGAGDPLGVSLPTYTSPLVWAEDGRMVAQVDSSDEKVKVYEFSTGQLRHEIHSPGASAATFCPRGLHLAVVSAEGVIRVYRLGQARVLFEVVVRSGVSVAPVVEIVGAKGVALPAGGEGTTRVAFSPDGRFLAASCATDVRVWDMAGKPVGVFRGHEEGIHDLAFSADSRTLVTASADGTALIWDINYMQSGSQEASDRPGEESLWADLASSDASRAFRAMAALRDRPTPALKLLSARLLPAETVEPKTIRKLLDDLESDAAVTRRRAAVMLEALDVQVERELSKTLEATTSAEVRRAIGKLLSRLEGTVSDPERMRELRAVEVLETIGNSVAQAILARLSKGADARLTREAKEALARLAAKPTK